MNREEQFDLLVAEWLEEGPYTAPDAAIDAAIEYAQAHPRRHFLPSVFRRNVMSRFHAAPLASPPFHYPRGRLAIGLTAAAVLVIALAATAGLLALRGSAPAPVAASQTPISTWTHIYWANHLNGTIGRANIDGTEVNQRFVVGRPGMCGLAVVGDYIYWANDDENTIGRVKLDGTGASQTLVTSTGGACGLASDGTYLFWTTRNGSEEGSIGRSKLDGTEEDEAFVQQVMPPSLIGIAVGQGFIFWGSAADAVGCVRTDGRFANGYCASLSNPSTGVAVAQGHLYWGNGQGTTIGRATIAVSDMAETTDADESFMTVAGNPEGLASDGTYLYWSAAGAIGRANLDGSGANDTFIGGASAPRGIAIGR